MLPMLICFAVMVWSFMSAMVHGPAANAIWLQYLAPAWVLVLGVVLLKEPVTAADVRMVAGCSLGVLLILVMEMRDGSNLLATGLGILSGLSFAGVVLCMRRLRDQDPAWLITLNHLATALLLAPWALQVQGDVPYTSYFALAMFGVFQMSVPYILFARGLRTVTSPEASVLSLIEPLLVPVWVFVAWRTHPSYEAPQWWTLVGGGIIFSALLGRYAPALWCALRKTPRNLSQRRGRASPAAVHAQAELPVHLIEPLPEPMATKPSEAAADLPRLTSPPAGKTQA